MNEATHIAAGPGLPASTIGSGVSTPAPVKAAPKVVRQRVAHCPRCDTGTNQAVHEVYVDPRTRLTVSWQCLACEHTISVVSAKRLRAYGLLTGQDVVPVLADKTDYKTNPLA